MIFKKKILFNKISREWLLFKKFSVKESTYFRYSYIINKYISPYFRDKKLEYFNNFDFSKYTEHLLKKLSTKTVSDIVIVFKSILKYACNTYKLNYNINLIPIPRKNQLEIKILSKNEEKKLQDFCFKKNKLKYIGIIICLNTGIRIGEICSLSWNNIDLKEKVIIINKTVQRIYKGERKTEIKINEPKTFSSIRKIPLSDRLIAILNEIKKHTYIKENTYFLTGTEKIIEPRNYYSFYKNVLNECNLPSYSFHSLRHTFATNCVKVGMDPKSLSEILGHSDVKITLNRYVHSSYNMKKKFLNKL